MKSKEILRFVAFVGFAVLRAAISEKILIEPTFESSDFARLQDAAIDILRSCFHGKRLVSLAGSEWIEMPTVRNTKWERIPVTLIGNSTSNGLETYASSHEIEFLYRTHQLYKLEHKLEVAIVAAPSKEYFAEIMLKLKHSMWWNSQGFFIIVALEDNCQNAYTFLRITLYKNILSSVLICHNSQEGLIMYAYNPFTSNSPSTWKEAGVYEGRKGHPWTMFKRKYVNGRSSCKDLNFDKTRNLGGYMIRSNAMIQYPWVFLSRIKSCGKKLSGEDALLSETLWGKLNATCRVRILPSYASNVGYITENGTLSGLLTYVGNRSVDYSMNARPLTSQWNTLRAYPHGMTGLCAITKHRGFVTQLGKIRLFLSIQFWEFLLLVAILSLIVLKYLVDRKFFDAFLDVVGMITLNSMHRLPRSNPVRIIFAPVFMFLLIIHTLIDSRLASFLVKPMLNPNVETIEDLINGEITVFVSPAYENYLRNHGIQKFGSFSNNTCIDDIKNDKNIACIRDCLYLQKWIKNEHFHISHNMILPQQRSFATKKDWLLYGKFNMLVQRINEAGLVDFWRRHSLYELHGSNMYNAHPHVPDDNKVLDLGDFYLSFTVLGIGLTCATVVFVIEILIVRYEKNLANLKTALQKFVRNLGRR